MFRIFTTVAILLIIALGCTDKPHSEVLVASSRDEVGNNESKIPVPPFQLRVTLSEAAARKVQDTGETIKGAIYFDGDGIRKDHEETAPFRTVFLGKYEFEVSEAGIVSVSDAMISEEAFNRLSDPDYCYTVNVFSGRRVFKDNILDGGYAGGHINDAVTTRIEINCDLIEK